MPFESKDYGQKFAKGLFRDKAKHEAFKRRAVKYPYFRGAVVLPGKTNFRSKMAPCENQAQCGSCWDFSVTNTLRSQVMIASGDPGALSKNYLLLNKGPGPSEMGCQGGDFDAGQNMLSGHGPCLESLSPYTGSDSGVDYPANAPVAATALQWVVIGDGQNRPTAQQLCEAIYNGGKGACLSVDVAADDTWSNYSGGIYDQNTSQSIDHMVRFVDYDAETSVDANGNAVFNADGSFKNGDGFFYLRNNWDTSWGEQGDMRTRYGANNVAETAMTFMVTQPVPVPPVPPTPPVPPVPPAPVSGGLPVWAWIVIGVAAVVGVGVLVLIEAKNK